MVLDRHNPNMISSYKYVCMLSLKNTTHQYIQVLSLLVSMILHSGGPKISLLGMQDEEMSQEHCRSGLVGQEDSRGMSPVGRSGLVGQEDSRGRQKLMGLTRSWKKFSRVEIVLHTYIYYIHVYLFFGKKTGYAAAYPCIYVGTSLILHQERTNKIFGKHSTRLLDRFLNLSSSTSLPQLVFLLAVQVFHVIDNNETVLNVVVVFSTRSSSTKKCITILLQSYLSYCLI